MAGRHALRLAQAVGIPFSSRTSTAATRMPRAVGPRHPTLTGDGAAAHRFLSNNIARHQKGTVQQAEVPVSVYAPDSKHAATSAAGEQHFNIPLDRDAAMASPVPDSVPTNGNEAAVVKPLCESAYDLMPQTMKNMSVRGKVVLVTGGARGLGNNMARALVEAGAKALVIFDVQQETGDLAAAELHQQTGGRLPVSFFRVDVRDGEAINAALDQVIATHGCPDIMVNSAGIADSNLKAETYDPALFRRMIDINLNGSFLMAQACGRAMMREGKPGSIIFVASMSGSVVNYPQEQSCYNASKAGVIHLGKSLAAEWAKYRIRVNMISPGYMDTALNRVPALEAQKEIWKSLTPQNRLGSVDDLNGLCVYLASDSSSFLTGADIRIDGGYSLY